MVFINELIGEFGKFHLWLCVLLFSSKFGVGFHQMAIIFLAPRVQYKCPGANVTCCDNPVFDTSIYKKTIITEWNLICRRSWLKDFTQTLFQLGVFIGSLIFGMASDRYGRKPAMIVAVVIEIFSGIMSSFLPDYWSFTIMRMILGISVGGVMVVGFVLTMEYIGSSYRPMVSAVYHIPFTVGHMLLAMFGYFIRDYMYFQLAISLTCVFLLVFICLLPESPRWLLVMRKTEDAVLLITQVAQCNNLPTEDVQRLIHLYQMEHKNLGLEKGTLLDLFRKPNMRKNIIIMSALWLVCSFYFYGVAQYTSHMQGDVYLNTIASGGVCFLSCVLSIPLMKWMSRRCLSIICFLLSGICMILIIVVPQGIAEIILGCIGTFASFLLFVVLYLYCTEMFPTVVRNVAIGLSSMMGRLGSMLAPFVATMEGWGAPLVFGIFPFLVVFLILFLPETKGCELVMTLEEGEGIGRNPQIDSAAEEIVEETA